MKTSIVDCSSTWALFSVRGLFELSLHVLRASAGCVLAHPGHDRDVLSDNNTMCLLTDRAQKAVNSEFEGKRSNFRLKFGEFQTYSRHIYILRVRHFLF